LLQAKSASQERDLEAGADVQADLGIKLAAFWVVSARAVLGVKML
jgi:hypothetical protein